MNHFLNGKISSRLLIIYSLIAFAASLSSFSEASSSVNQKIENKKNNEQTQNEKNSVFYHTSVQDPCSYKDLDDLPNPIISDVFENNEVESKRFQADIVDKKEIALKNWLISTKTFSNFKSLTLDDIKLELILDRGVGHAGVYKVIVSNLRFILKISVHDNEASKIWKLKNSFLGHPKCWLKADSELSKNFASKEIDFFPRMPKVFEAEKFRYDVSKHKRLSANESATHHYLILMEEARGESLFSLSNSSKMEISKLYYTVGKSMGYFHYFLTDDVNLPYSQWSVWKHGDLHLNNLFVDLTNRVTFIDSESMYKTPTVDSNDKNYLLFSDIDTLAYHSFNYLIYRDNGFFKPIIDNEINIKNKIFGIEILDYSNGYSFDKAIKALEDPTIQEKIKNSSIMQQVSTRFKKFKSLASGYIESFPESKRDEIRVFFGSQCRLSGNNFMRAYSDNKNGLLEDRLIEAFRVIFPPEFISCMDNDI